MGSYFTNFEKEVSYLEFLMKQSEPAIEKLPEKKTFISKLIHIYREAWKK